MVDTVSRESTSRYPGIPHRCTCRRSRLEDRAYCAQCPKCRTGRVFRPACAAQANSDSVSHRAAAGRQAWDTAAIVRKRRPSRTMQPLALEVVSCASFIHQLREERVATKRHKNHENLFVAGNNINAGRTKSPSMLSSSVSGGFAIHACARELRRARQREASIEVRPKHFAGLTTPSALRF